MMRYINAQIRKGNSKVIISAPWLEPCWVRVPAYLRTGSWNPLTNLDGFLGTCGTRSNKGPGNVNDSLSHKFQWLKDVLIFWPSVATSKVFLRVSMHQMVTVWLVPMMPYVQESCWSMWITPWKGGWNRQGLGSCNSRAYCYKLGLVALYCT